LRAAGPGRGTFAPRMAGKRSKLYSILWAKCPHCHEGEFFVDRNPYNLRRAGDLLDACPVCRRRYSPEPGFYYGAMYLSYGLGVLLMTLVYLVVVLVWPSVSMWGSIWASVGSLFLLAPWMYALSKSIWGNLFFRYKGVAPTAEEARRGEERTAVR